jgi:hypothetical protein
VAADLSGPRRHRVRILAELGDGLEEAVASRVADGLPRRVATVAALDEFGPPRAVAAAFAGELATAAARRTVGWFVVTGPLVGVWWLLLLHPHQWRTGLVALLAAIPVIPLVAVALATAAGTFATTGRLMRWLPETGPRLALTAAMAVAILAIGGDAVILGVWIGSGPGARPLAVVAVGASLIRVGCSLVALRRTVALRRRLADRADPGAHR